MGLSHLLAPKDYIEQILLYQAQIFLGGQQLISQIPKQDNQMLRIH